LRREHSNLITMLTYEIVQAAENGLIEKVQNLLIEVDAEDIDGRTLLHVAVRHGRKKVAEYLLSRNANINARERFIGGFTPLHEAVCSQHKMEIVKLLVDHGATIDLTDDEGLTPFYRACTFYKCDIEVVKMLLKRGAFVDHKDKRGRTPLLHATLQRNLALMGLLLDSGASIDCKDREGCTPLLRAVQQQKIESVRLLINRGANILAVSKDFRSPLSCAIEKGSTDALYWMIRSRPEVWEQISMIEACSRNCL